MSSAVLADSPELLTQVFYEPEFLRAVPLQSEPSVLAYFLRSPFARGVTSDVAYSVRKTGQDLFVIERRISGSGVLIGLYYCLQGRVYQCPDLATICSARIERAAVHLRHALEFLEPKARGAGIEKPLQHSVQDAAVFAASRLLTDMQQLLT
jgi:hypothetical protein